MPNTDQSNLAKASSGDAYEDMLELPNFVAGGREVKIYCSEERLERFSIAHGIFEKLHSGERSSTD